MRPCPDLAAIIESDDYLAAKLDERNRIVERLGAKPLTRRDIVDLLLREVDE